MNIKVSVIGSGRWGKNIVQKFHKLGVLHLVYGHQNRGMLKESCNAVFTEDMEELINSSDAVAIVTPPATHFELALKVLRSGKDLFLEKPIALSVEEARKLAELADSKERVMLIGHILCYGTPYEKLNSLPGKPVSAEACFLKTSSPEKLLNAYWNFGIHMIALATALGVPEDSFLLVADDQAAENRRTFTLITQEPNGKEHILTWDFLDPQKREDILLVECQHFLDCVNLRQKPRTNAWHAVEVMKRLVKICPRYEKHMGA
jgi:predicted dehydrogenase